ncbi:hypothetical protein DFP72DRAFT_1012058, partial [Ephemerocybe angulata]
MASNVENETSNDEEGSEDEDEELGPEFATIQEAFALPLPSEFSSRQEFVEYNKRAQLALGDAIDEIRSLKLENTRLKNEVDAMKSRGPRKGKKGSSAKGKKVKKRAETTEEAQFSQLGKQYFIFHELFPNKNAFGKPKPEDAVDHPDRFKNSASILRGQTAELYEFIPEEFQSYIEGLASFKEEIVKSALDCRRSHWSQLRSKTAPTIFAFLNPPPGIFNTNQSKERGEYPPFQAFSAFPGDNSIFRPFLFPNQTKDFKVIFQCDWLVEIMRSLIFGANSIGGGSKAPNSNGMLWDSSQITEGLLSTACTSTLFMVSPDKAFSTVGTQSKINYKEAYHGYRKFILAALRDGSPSQKRMQRTFKWLNARVFADGPAPAENSTSQPNNDEFSVALAAMSIDDNDSDDSDHNSGDDEDGGEGSDREGGGNNKIEGEGGGDENDAM